MPRCKTTCVSSMNMPDKMAKTNDFFQPMRAKTNGSKKPMGTRNAILPIILSAPIMKPYSPNTYGKMVLNGTKFGSPTWVPPKFNMIGPILIIGTSFSTITLTRIILYAKRRRKDKNRFFIV